MTQTRDLIKKMADFTFKEDVLDAISRIGLLKSDTKEVKAIAIAECLRAVEALPPVTPQPKTEWIPVKFRPLTDEEQKEYPDYCYMADCPMPDDGEEILVSTKNGRIEKDECGFDDGYYLDSGYDWQTDIVAWMPLPEPYKAESEDKE